MKLTDIHITNFLGARAVNIALHPVHLVCGPNGAGKSSIADAISLALTGDLCRVEKKGEAAALISEGASAAHIELVFADGSCGAAISKAGKITRDAASEPHAALPFVLDPQRFAALDETARRQFLFGLMGVQITHDAIAERLARRSCDPEKIEAVKPILRSGFAAGERHAREQASQARGAWKAVTGEAYGDKKADGWQPAAVQVEGDPVTKAEHAEAKVAECDAEIDGLQQQIGAAQAQARAYADARQRVERLREQAGMGDRIKARLATAEENVENCRQQLAARDGKSGLVHELAYSLSESLRLAIPFGDMSDEQRGALKAANAALDAYQKQHGKPEKPTSVDAARAAEIRKALQTAETGAANARRDLAAAEAAAAELTEAEKNLTGEPVGVEKLEATLAEVRQRRADWQADAQKYRAAAGAVERRQQQIEAAAGHHADVQQWCAVEAALSADGIQAEMLAEALDPLNKLLAENAALAEWAAPRVGADMSITADGRAYGLLSESERWRVDALLAASIARLSGLALVVLDRMDVLDAGGRGDVLYWLSDLAEAGHIETAVVLATLKSAPPADALPEHVGVTWIGKDAAEAVREAA